MRQDICDEIFVFVLQEVFGECGLVVIQIQGLISNLFGSIYVYGYKDVVFEVKDFFSNFNLVIVIFVQIVR